MPENIAYCRNIQPDGFVTFKVSPVSVSCLESFSRLSSDAYAKGCNRSRRFSQFKAVRVSGVWNLQTLEHRPFVQSKEYNSHSGGLKRQFDPIEYDFSSMIVECFDQLEIDLEQDYQLDIHQYRVEAMNDSEGNPVPEGPHQDGHEVVGIIVLRRHNVNGAENALFDLSGSRFKRLTLQENECIFIDDGKMFHDATPITVKDPEKGLGYRDYVVININRWDNRRYGAEFEKNAL